MSTPEKDNEMGRENVRLVIEKPVILKSKSPYGNNDWEREVYIMPTGIGANFVFTEVKNDIREGGMMHLGGKVVAMDTVLKGSKYIVYTDKDYKFTITVPKKDETKKEVKESKRGILRVLYGLFNK